MNKTFKIGDLVYFDKPFPADIMAPFVVNFIDGEFISLLNRDNPLAPSVRHIHASLLALYVDDGTDPYPAIGFGKDSLG